MKTSRFSESQVALALRQVDEGVTVGEVCRKRGLANKPIIDGERSTGA